MCFRRVDRATNESCLGLLRHTLIGFDAQHGHVATVAIVQSGTPAFSLAFSAFHLRNQPSHTSLSLVQFSSHHSRKAPLDDDDDATVRRYGMNNGLVARWMTDAGTHSGIQ